MELDITKESFLKAYNNYPPNWWINFTYSFFSKNNVKKKLKLKNIYSIIFIILFIIGFIGVIFKLNKKLIIVSIYLYSILLIIFSLSISITIIMNNHRIKKICKELNITTKEYNKLSKKYFKK